MRRLLLACLAVMSVSAAGASASMLASSGAAGPGVGGASAGSGPSTPARTAAVKRKGGKSQPARQTYLFGNRTVGRGMKPMGSVEFFRLRDSKPGMASAIMVYVAKGSRASRLMLGLYSDRAGHPGVRMAEGSLRSPRAGAWDRIAIARTRVKPQSYWVALLGQGGALSLRGVGGCQGQEVSGAAMGSLPRVWKAGDPSSGCDLSAYVSGTSSTSGGSSSAPTTIVAGPLAPTLPVAGTGSTTASTTTDTTTTGGTLTLPPVDVSPPVISGTATVGDVLRSSTGSWADSPNSYAYQWQQCSLLCTDISGATNSSYTLASADVGDTIDVVVTASNAGGSGSATSAQTATVTAPPAPSNTGLPVVSGTAQQGDTLTTSNGSWSGSPTSYGYQWQRCSSSCSNISGATSSSYTLASADVGDTVRSVVTATNTGGSTPADSAQTGTVAGVTPPGNTALPVVSGTAEQGDTLTTSNGSWSGSPTSYGYQWQRCSSSCSNISGATSSSYTLAAADVGDTVRSVVTATNAGGSTPADSAQTGTVSAPPAPSNTGLPVVSGTAQEGDTLTTSNGSWSGSPTSYGYQWQRCASSCSNISGATSSSYTLAAADVGDTVRSVVTATNAGGSTPADSAQTVTVAAPPPPGDTALPVISGTAQQGDTLSTSNGSWSGSPTSYGYQWQDCTGSGCSNITGATSSSYVLQSSDVGDTIDVVVTATNANGSTPATSAQTATVTASSGGGSGNSDGLHVSAQDEPCPDANADTCSDLLDASGNIVHMHGVDLSGTETACVTGGGFGIFASPDGNGVAQNSAASVASMVAWNINFVRIQLNEDCWLGINTSGLNSSYVDTACTSWPGGCTAAPPSTGEPYANAITSFVNLLNENGIYAEIVDMWDAPGTDVAVGQSGSSSSFNGGDYYGPDEDHSPDMWASMANTWASNPEVILSPAGEEDVSMACQMNGCSNEGLAPNNVDGLGSGSFNGGSGYYYKVAGLSQGVTVMRSNGFDGPIALECAHFGGTCDCSQSGTSCAGGVTSGATWVADRPTDTLDPSQILAEVHNYGTGDCAAGPSCFDAQYAPVVDAGYPMFYGELGDGSNSDCSDTYLPEATSWADAHEIGYMTWTWTADEGDCTSMIGDYTNAEPPTAASFTGSTTNETASITSASSTSGLTVGQVVAGSGLPPGDTIVSISGSTLTMSLDSTATASSVSLTAEQANWGWVKAHDQSYMNAPAHTNVSQGQPTYANSDAVNPSYATDGTYDSSNSGGCGCNPGASHYYECDHTASTGDPCYLDVDVSSTLGDETCDAAGTCKVVVAFYHPGGSGDWEDTPSLGSHVYNIPGNYTIDACTTSCSGTPPSSGWTNMQTVTGNIVSDNVSPVLALPANTKWIRFYDTAPSSLDQSGNTDLEMQLDILSCSSCATGSTGSDSWLFLGDSLTDYTMSTQEPDNFMQATNSEESQYYPVAINGGVGSDSSPNELGALDSNETEHSFTANTTSGSTSITSISSTSGLADGQTVVGTGIPDGATILSISGSTLKVNLPATATNSSESLTAGSSYFDDVLNNWKGQYVALDYTGLSEVCNSHMTDTSRMIAALTYGGFRPAMWYSTEWTSDVGTDSDEQNINQLADGPALPSGTCDGDGATYLFMRYPTLLVGPDEWDFFTQDNTFPPKFPSGCTAGTNCVEDDTNVHPGHPVGENAGRQLWVQAALFNAHAG